MWARYERKIVPYLFISPFFVTFLAFMVYPILFAGYISLTNWHGQFDPEFRGLRNYSRLLTDDAFWLSVLNTATLAAGALLIMLPLALLLALLLDAKWVWGRGVYRMLFFLPIVTVPAVAATVFAALYGTDRGVFNWILSGIGIGPIPWLDSELWQKPAILGIIIWRSTGYMMVLFLAGLQGIPHELHEAAAVDGADTARRFRFVTLPLLRPVILFTAVLTTINVFQTFEEPYMLNLNSQGMPAGPGDAGLTMAFYLYRMGFSYTEFGYAAAVGIVIMIAIAGLTLFQSRILGLFGED